MSRDDERSTGQAFFLKAFPHHSFDTISANTWKEPRVSPTLPGEFFWLNELVELVTHRISRRRFRVAVPVGTGTQEVVSQ